MYLRRPAAFLLVVAGLVVLTVPSFAREQVKVGVQGAWGSRMHTAVGARVTVAPYKTRKALEMLMAYDHFFPDDDLGIDIGYAEVVLGVSYNLTALLKKPVIYLGVEVTGGKIKAHTDALGATLTGRGIRWYGGLLTGMRFPLGRFKPFVEGRLNTGKASQFVFSTGVLLLAF